MDILTSLRRPRFCLNPQYRRLLFGSKDDTLIGVITGEELSVLKRRYGVNAIQTCGLCGKPMKLRTIFPNDELAFRCLRSEAKKYSKEWWDHVERSETQGGPDKDPLVLKLIEAYERITNGQDAI